MSEVPAVSFALLLDYQEEQTELWRELFTKRPFLLELEGNPSETVADVLFHAFTTEYRAVQRVIGEPMTQDSAFSRRTVGDLFSISEAAHLKMREYLAHVSPDEIAKVKAFPSPTLGEFHATPRKLLLHALVHTVRHSAQIARALREQGHRIDFSGDVLFSKRLQ